MCIASEFFLHYFKSMSEACLKVRTIFRRQTPFLNIYGPPNVRIKFGKQYFMCQLLLNLYLQVPFLDEQYKFALTQKGRKSTKLLGKDRENAEY